MTAMDILRNTIEATEETVIVEHYTSVVESLAKIELLASAPVKKPAQEVFSFARKQGTKKDEETSQA